MGFRIQNNIAAMNAHRNLGVSDAGMSKSLERLSSGTPPRTTRPDWLFLRASGLTSPPSRSRRGTSPRQTPFCRRLKAR